MSPAFRLVLAPRVWREQIPQLVRQGGLGLCHPGRNFHPEARELVALDCRVAPAARGRQYGPLDDLLLLAVEPRVAAGDARRLLAAFAPLPKQLAAALVLGRGPAAGRWTAAVWEDGSLHRLPEVALVGPHMRRLRAGQQGHITSADDDGEGWSRTRGALGPEVHRRVRESRVAVVGAGRNGSAAALSLAMIGVASIVIIDGDVEDLHSLDATIGATPEGVGRPKVHNRADLLRRVRPDDLEVQAIPHPLPHPACLEALRPVDLVVTCVDRDAPRLAAAVLANRRWWCKVHLDVGTGVFWDRGRRQMGGEVKLLLPGEACVACLSPGLRDLEGARYELAAPPGALRRGPRREWHEQRGGSSLPANMAAVNLVGLQVWLDLLAGVVTESRWCRVEWEQDGTLRVQHERTPSPACEVCRPRRPAEA